MSDHGETDHESGPWPKAAASAVLFRGEAVLLVLRDKGHAAGTWSLPGGTIHAGETAEAAARREVEEETGLIAHIEGLAGVYDLIDRNEGGEVVLDYVIATYYGRADDGEPRAKDDVREARFFALDAAKDLELTHGTYFVIEQAWRLLAASVE